MYLKPLSCLRNEKSSKNMSWCPPVNLVIRNAASKQNTLSPFNIRGFGAWLPRSPLDHNISSSLVVSAFDAQERFTEEASFPVEYFATVDKLSVPRQLKCCCLLPVNEGQGTLSLPANCLARSLNHLILLTSSKNFCSFEAYKNWTFFFFFSSCGPNSNPGSWCFPLCSNFLHFPGIPSRHNREIYPPLF